VRRTWILIGGFVSLSCAGRQPTAAPTTSTRDRQAEEVIALDRQIQGWRHELGLSPDPPPKFFRETGETIPWSPSREPATAECKDVCNLAEHICANKDDICRIADDLPGDTWAEGKCKTAKASCNEARERCNSCK
jgi:hypothetical protein